MFGERKRKVGTEGEKKSLEEGKEKEIKDAGKSFLLHDEIDTLEEVYRKVSAVTAEQIMEVAEEIFARTSTLIYQ